MHKKMGVKPSGVLHVGAHEGEESADYLKFGWGHVVWVEAQPRLAAKLREQLDPQRNSVIEAAAWSQSGEKVKFNIASNSQSSSLLEFGSHAESYPTIKYVGIIEVETKRLDEVFKLPVRFNFINLDVQGAELEVLKGLDGILSGINWIYTEVNRKEVYKGCGTVEEIDNFLQEKGFNRVSTRWVYGKGWGDSLYTREQFSINPIWKEILNFPWVLVEVTRYMVKKSLRRN
jgi:FkbM family methyltransferase